MTAPAPSQSTIEDALVTWIAAAAGISEDNVLWTMERSPQVKGCYIAITLGGEAEIGGDWTELRDIAEEDQLPGEDIDHVLIGPRTRSLKLECFAAGDKWEIARPEAKLARVVKARNLPTRAQALRKAGIGFGTIGPVVVQGLERSVIFESRAVVEMTLHVTSEISERGTWIERVVISPTIKVNPDAAAVALPSISVPELALVGEDEAGSSSTADLTLPP